MNPILTPEDHQAVLAEVDSLMESAQPNTPDGDRLTLLIDSLIDYEKKRFPEFDQMMAVIAANYDHEHAPFPKGDRLTTILEQADKANLLKDLERALPEAGGDQGDASLFQSLVQRSAQALKLSDDDISDLFGISRPTANRWRNGNASPHPGMRKHIYRRLIARLKKAE